jgi:hypothetical protein
LTGLPGKAPVAAVAPADEPDADVAAGREPEAVDPVADVGGTADVDAVPVEDTGAVDEDEGVVAVDAVEGGVAVPAWEPTRLGSPPQPATKAAAMMAAAIPVVRRIVTPREKSLSFPSSQAQQTERHRLAGRPRELRRCS